MASGEAQGRYAAWLRDLNAVAEAHRRRFPERPWRLYMAPRDVGGPARVLATFTTRERAEDARAAWEILDRDLPRATPVVYWTELRR